MHVLKRHIYVVRAFAVSNKYSKEETFRSGQSSNGNSDDPSAGKSDHGQAFDTQEEALLNMMNFKDWTRRVVTLEDGVEALETGGRITSYLNPDTSGRLKDRLVDKRLVDEFGVSSVDDLTEGQQVEYFAGEEDLGNEWV